MDKKEHYLQELVPVGITAIMLPFGLWVLAIPYLFIEKWCRKQTFQEIGFSHKGILKDFYRYWWIIILPVVSALLSIFLSRAYMTDVYNHIIERTRDTLVFDKAIVLIPQFFILALMEEVVFRAFFQRKLGQCIRPIWAIILTSLIFSLGHFSVGSPIVVIWDLMGVFLDSIIYGLLFYKTKNVYLCWMSHFIANVAGFFILTYLDFL